mgnify:CR=1 FL=1
MITSITERIEYIEKLFGKGNPTSQSTNIEVYCPFCKDSNPNKKKLAIKIDDFQNHCWVCGWRARNLFSLLLKIGKKQQAIEFSKKFEIQITNIVDHKEAIELPKDFLAIDLEEFSTSKNPMFRNPAKYILNRNITPKRCNQLRMGICPTSFPFHVVIPSYDSQGNLNYFTARNCNTSSKRRYTNCDKSSSEIIFNEIDIVWSKPITIVEGPFDLAKCELDNITCLLGSSLNEQHPLIEKLLLNDSPVIIALDKDATKKTIKICDFLSGLGIDLKIVLPKEQDFGSLTPLENHESITQAIPYTWDVSFKLKTNHVFKF